MKGSIGKMAFRLSLQGNAKQIQTGSISFKPPAPFAATFHANDDPRLRSSAKGAGNGIRRGL
jgi:hypothetical protein